MFYLIRRVLAKPRLILDEMCRLYGKFASYLRRVLSKTRLIFPRINGPLVTVFDAILTNRQTCEKLQCVYENLMSNNFRKTAVLKKKKNDL